MRVLITGGAGQLGRALTLALAGHDVSALSRSELDVTDAAAVRAYFSAVRPDAVVHCAALTDTTACERDWPLAHRVNAEGTQHVADRAAASGARLAFISTNEVFDGEATEPYAEDAEPAPINNYGLSKHAGEELARRICPDTLIVRTSWLYGDGGTNFETKVRSALANAAPARPLRFVTDEVASPTYARDAAAAIARLIEVAAPPGVYHLANAGAASRFDWARETARLAGADPERIAPCTTAELRAAGYHGPHKPVYSVLENRAARALGIALRPWRDALAEHAGRAKVASDA
jgi:dTDP-4-dehydrorhamnose reductase